MSEEMPFRDSSLPIDQRVDDLVGRLNLGEKIGQLCNDAPAIPRLGIPENDYWNECLHGVGRAGRATVFPQAIGMAASFDEDLMYEVATVISDEARAKHHEAQRQGNRRRYFGLTYWTPNINIFRDPRWGRGQETYGEDPFLSGLMGVAFIRGLQGDDEKYLKLVATPKHFAVHSGKESERHHFNAEVNERDLRETYLPHFQKCVQQGGAWSVMGAYNRTNGEPCCGSKTLLQDILRDEWGFRGYVVSDCGAVADFHENHKVTETPAESAAMALENGCDLNCGETFQATIDAVQEGLIDEETVDRALRRVLRARFKLGMFDPPEQVPYASIPAEVVGCEEHAAISRQMARESIVLLKNEDDCLPLDDDQEQILVVGPNSDSRDVLLANYNGYPSQYTTPLEGVMSRVSAGTNVVHLKGCDLASDEREGFEDAVRAAEDSDVVIACMGLSPRIEGEEGDADMSEEQGDRRTLGLPGVQEELLRELHEAGTPVVLVLLTGSAVTINWAEDNLPAIINAWYPGQEGGHAIADVLFGDYSPSGRLPVTFPASVDDLPPFRDYDMQGHTYRFMEAEPLYPFGYGLSYTSFDYSNITLSSESINADESVVISAEVTNTGGRAGEEVVQFYVSDLEASVPVPRLHLEGVRRVHLRPGETRTVSCRLTPRQLAAFDDAGNPFVESGEFEISIGGGQPTDESAGAVTATLEVV
ncbi:MAG: glycoside hydrolase family 3 C-terminal domain-containing protein [Planctomycetota bacterium]